MHKHFHQVASRLTGVTAALAVAGLVSGSCLAAVAAPTAPAPSSPAVASGAPRPLLLITGDRLAVRSADGRQQIAVRYAARRDDVIGLRMGQQVTEIPAYALPYLGRGLSPSLFQVSALEKAEPGSQLPVEVRFSGPLPTIPGLTVTRSSAGAASGYLTAASARKFGAALKRQYLADHSRARYGTDGLFGHGVSISLAGASPSPGPAPAFKMHTLTVTGRNLRGNKDTGDDIFVVSADNINRFAGLSANDNFFYHGTAKFSVPSGHYWAIATFFTGSSLRMVVLPQFTVAGKRTTVHVAEKSATSKFTMSAPRPTVNQGVTFEIIRGARTGGSFAFANGWSGLTGWVNPTTRKPTVGTLRTFTSATLGSRSHVKPGYVYNLDFPGPAGIIPPQHFAVRPAGLATVNERFYQDVRSGGGWAAFGGTVAQLNAGEFQEVFPITMPQRQTQYFSAGHGLLWSELIFTNLDQFIGFMTNESQAFRGGQRMTEDWNRYPLHPAPDAVRPEDAKLFPAEPSADRMGNTLNLLVTPFSDNSFTHLGPGFFDNGNATVTGTYVIDQNGVTIAHGSALNEVAPVKLSAQPSTVRFTLNASRVSKFFRFSPSSQTIWTWRSVRDTAARVPAAWFCDIAIVKNRVVFERKCAVQPMMTLNYLVQGLALNGLTKPGSQVINVTAGHIQLGGSAAITGATAQVSYNDGDSWQAAHVTSRGGGHFRVSYHAPPGVDVSLRVSATDSAGGSVRETIVRAYGVSQ